MQRFSRSSNSLSVVAFIVCWFSVQVTTATERDSAYRAALESIRVDQLTEHVDYLADDKMRGRRAGTPEARATADYLAERFARIELRGAGSDDTFFQPFSKDYRNVVAMLPGSDPELTTQVIILGAHYDHVGLGNRRSSNGTVGQIHNGADDNASGTAALLELAEAFTLLAEAPKRSVLFIAFDAEEIGLLGSKHWTEHPTVVIDRVDAMLNLDMVGRLRDNRVTVFGSRSAYGSRQLISRANTNADLLLDFSFDIKRNSDHYCFFQKNIPVLFLHTGTHADYHTQRDDPRRINGNGMGHVTRLMFAVAYELAQRDEPLRYRAVAKYEAQRDAQRLLQRKSPRHDRLGAQWSRQVNDGRIRLHSVKRGSPAAEAGLRAGDRISEFAGRKIQDSDDLCGAISAAASPATVVYRRSGKSKPQEASVELTGKPLRLGITWRTDEAEPGALVLVDVVPGSPAARAGLRVGDRVYEVAGERFAGDREFLDLVSVTSDTLLLLIERNGQLLTIVLNLATTPRQQAA